MIFFLIPLGLIILVCGIFALAKRTATPGVVSVSPGLDKAGVITNWILGILYLPLSLLFSLSGMIGDGYVGTATPAQSVLLNIITWMGMLTMPVCVGGLLASVLLRNRGRSALSFAAQFAGLAFIALIIVLMLLVEML